MIVLKPNTTLQGFAVTPRNGTILFFGDTYAADKMKLTDEETGIDRVVDIVVNPFTLDYYHHSYSVTFNPALKEGHTYKVKLYATSEIYETWKGKLFCTNKIIDTEGYSVNDGKFIENTTTNQFILND
jgi:hypothetical protein